ncbi:putative cyclin-A3-1, partial [Mucuna pruriens]
METRSASNKKINEYALPAVVVEKPHPKRQRILLPEPLNLPNAIVSQTLDPPNVKKPSPTNNTLSSPKIDECYASDIYEYLHAMEKKRRPIVDYMEKVQKEITAPMRAMLMDWLVEVAEDYQLLPDTLHLSVSYIDRFLSINSMSKTRFQLLGVSSLFIASKYEEIDPPYVDQFCDVTENTFNEEEVIKMEADILKSLQFEMGNPTVNTFLKIFIGVASENQKTSNLQIEYLGSYLAELSLLDYDCLRFLPSIVAASVIFLARFIITPEVHPWSFVLRKCSGYESVELKECVLILYDLFLSRKAGSSKAVREKYKHQKMETRAAAKRKATAAPTIVVEKQHPKRQRVVLGELPNSTNLIVPETQNPHRQKLQCRRNPNAKKPIPTNNTLSSPQIGESYVSDIDEYLRSMETKRRPMVDYIEKVQKVVTANMRAILVDWLVDVAEEYKLLSETLHLSVLYIDRFLSVNHVNKLRLQLLGVSSMLVASKYEEINPPRVDKFCSITDNTYKKAEVVKMEAEILKSLNFELGNPTAITFLRRFLGVASEKQKTPNLKVEFLACYLAELSLLDYDCVRFLPSVVAASVVFLARFIIWPEVHPWTSSLCEFSGYKSVELKECVLILHDLYFSRKAASFQSVREKYKQHK